MSIQAVSFVLDSDVPEVAAKMLLVCLANAHNNETGLCCPSVARLAEESNMSRRSVQRWIKWLDENGFIDVIATASEAGRQQSNSYRLAGFHRGAKLTPLPRVGGATVGAGEGVTVDAPEGVTAVTPLKEPEENRNNEPECASVSFDDLWKAYPQRPMQNRSAALTEFNELSEAERVSCLAGAKRYAQWRLEDCQERKVDAVDHLQFVTGLAKWIHQRGWIEAMSLPVKNPNAGDMQAMLGAVEYVDRYGRTEKLFSACERLRGKPAPSDHWAFPKEIVAAARAEIGAPA